MQGGNLSLVSWHLFSASEGILGWSGPKSHSTEQLKNGALSSLSSASANITWAIVPSAAQDVQALQPNTEVSVLGLCRTLVRHRPCVMVDTFIDKLLYFVFMVYSLFEITCENDKFHVKVHFKTLKNVLMILFCAFASWVSKLWQVYNFFPNLKSNLQTVSTHFYLLVQKRKLFIYFSFWFEIDRRLLACYLFFHVALCSWASLEYSWLFF